MIDALGLSDVVQSFILLSYTRLLSSVAESLQLSVLQLETGGFKLRWLIDGNIKYFEGKHIPLAIFAIMLGLFHLLFVSFSFSGYKKLQTGKSSHVVINHLKSIFDVYTGPFTAIGRFWTGLLLLSRVILLVTTAVNVNGSPNTILGVILVVVVVLLLVVALLPAGLYQRKCLNILEYTSLVNLGLLSSLFLIFKYSSIVSHIFVSIEISIFVSVIVRHFSRNKIVRESICCRRLRMLQLDRIKLGVDDQVENDEACANNSPYYDEDPSS